MQRKKQSTVTISFDESAANERGYFACHAAETSEPEPAKKAPPLDRALLSLCSEIAGALLCRYFAEGDAKAVRSLIHDGLMEKLKCGSFQADRLIDLSLELIRAKGYGHFRRDPLELSLLIAEATDQFRDASLN